MPGHCSAFIATSLDGFIARDDGSLDWLEEANRAVPPGEDCGYTEYLATVNAIVVGRKTFELALSFPQWPYGTTPLHVLSSTLRRLPAAAPPSVSLHSASPLALVELASARGHSSLYIDGGRTIQGFIDADLLDEITVTTVPVLIGKGIPLFGQLSAPAVQLRHLSTRAFPFGFVQSRYALRGRAS